jgi:hypothetical protein
MTSPTRPHAIFSTLQGTQNPDTKPTLQGAKIQTHNPPNPADEYLSSLVRHIIDKSLLNTKAHQPTNGTPINFSNFPYQLQIYNEHHLLLTLKNGC